MTPHNLDDTIALLTRTPPALDALLRTLPDVWTRGNEGDGTWSAADVVGHLVHAERTNWMPRVRTLVASGETRPFGPFDREGHLRGVDPVPLPQLLAEFARLRATSLEELHALRLRSEDFERTGQHPALGRVTLAQLLATWAAHDLTHLHQISRVLAYQYRDVVGPWKQYLGVLRCAGHGD